MVGRYIHPLYHDEIEERMKIPCALASAQMKCMVWGYDAINFNHKHHTFNSTPVLHLLVSDSDIQLCAEAIVAELPKFQSDRGFRIFPHLPISTDTTWDEPLAFPHSVGLKFQGKRGRIPEVVLLHPQSQFYMDIQDYSRSFALRHFPDNIRIPTLAAFLDSLIEVHSDPPTGYDNKDLGRLLVDWEFDLFEGALGRGSQLLPNGRLRPACFHIKQSLKVENRPYFEAMARGGRSAPLLDTRLHRRSLLGTNPQLQVANSSKGAKDTTVSTKPGKFPTMGSWRPEQKRSYSIKTPKIRCSLREPANFNHRTGLISRFRHVTKFIRH